MPTPPDVGAQGAIIPILDRQVGDSINAVDARELHKALAVTTRFNDWFARRVADLGLAEGVDFEKLNDSAYSNLSSANRIDYVIGLDAAKHIAMAERNDAGRRVRAYFIAAEKRSRDPLAALADPNALRGLLLSYSERVIALEATVAESAPKVDAFDRVIASGETVGFREAAKILRRSTGVLERELAATIIDRGWAQRLGKRLAPAHYGEARGYVTSRLSEWKDIDGVTHVKPEIRVTPKGIARLARLLRPEAA